MPWVLLATLVPVAGLVFAGYWLVAKAQPGSFGLTTEIAAVVVCLLGAMTMLGHRELAIGLGVVTAAVLAYKQPLHGLVAKLGWDDVFAGVRLLIATFIILPLLPDRTLDPWDALNPYKLWLLVILISSLSLVGYVATRWLGAGRGTALTGITGGLVSSTAVTLSFARRGRDEPQASASLACGILIAWAVMFARVLVMVLAVNRDLLLPLLPPVRRDGPGGAGALPGSCYRRSDDAPLREDVPLKNPFSLTAAVKFGAPVRRRAPDGQAGPVLFPRWRRLCAGDSGRPHRCRRHHPVDGGVCAHQLRDGGRHGHHPGCPQQHRGQGGHGRESGRCRASASGPLGERRAHRRRHCDRGRDALVVGRLSGDCSSAPRSRTAPRAAEVTKAA